MSFPKACLAGGPLALLAAGCIIIPGNPTPGGANPWGSVGHMPGLSAPRTEAPQPYASLAPREATVPVIAALTANPTTLTRPGQEVVFHIEAVDASGTPAYTWTATGGTLSATAGTRVSWRSPDKPGRYTILVVVTSPSGGATTGAINIEVSRDGRGQVNLEPQLQSSPLPEPTPSASPEAQP